MATRERESGNRVNKEGGGGEKEQREREREAGGRISDKEEDNKERS